MGNDRGDLVGTNTLGRAARQRLVKLPDQSGLWLTYLRYLTPSGDPIHEKGLMPDVLKQRMNFDGFTVGDWNGHGQVKGCTNDNCPQAINAGLDMYMAPDSWKGLYENTLKQAKDGTIPLRLRCSMRVRTSAKPSASARSSSASCAAPRQATWRASASTSVVVAPCAAAAAPYR